MLMDDLMQYGRGNTDLDRRIKNKCEADLIYYAILREMIHDYGVSGLKDIANIDPDALCISRDQMASLASDDGLLRFDSDERVTGFFNPNTNGYDRRFTDASRSHFVRESFLNCKALRDMVSTSLASSPAYRSRSMTDDEFEAAVDLEFEQRILNAADPGSPFSRVLDIACSFDETMGVDARRDYYAMAMPEERMVRDESDAQSVMNEDRARRATAEANSPGRIASAFPGRNAVEPGDKIIVLDGAGRPNPIMGLKLSPLMPEFETLRRSGMGDALGLYKDQAGHARAKDPNQYDKNNGILMFDAQKRMLSAAPDPAKGYASEYLSQKRGLELVRANGIMFGESEYLRTQGYTSEATMFTESGYEDGDGFFSPEIDLSSGVKTSSTAYARTNAGYTASFRTIHAWKMAQVLDRLSGQQLTDSDHAAIQKIMSPPQGSGGTIFGDPERDGETAVNANADAYFNYIAHVCGDVRDKMASHEFGIHFEEQNYFSDRRGFVPLLYMTGERTTEYNRARANPSRYFAFYPFANYTPANIDVSPLAGDIAPASYNSFIVTNMAHRRSATDTSLSDPAKNKYAHVTRIDQDLVRDMRALYDGYVNGPQRGVSNIDIGMTKIRRRVGDTGLDDLSRFINADGSVNGALVTRVLVEDMNATKAVLREEFLSPANTGHMSNIFQVFAARNGCPSDDNNLSDTRLGDAIALFCQNSGADTPDGFSKALAGELEECMNIELRSAYGQDINSYRAMRHIYRAYLSDFASNCTGQLITDLSLAHGHSELPDLLNDDYNFDNDTYREFARRVLDRMPDPADPMLSQSLKDLFGTGEFEDGNNYIDPDVPQRIVLKANMGRYSSTQFLYQDYNDLLSLLAYSGYAAYEPDAGKPADSIMSGLRNQSPVAIQLYASESYGIDGSLEGAPEDDGGYDDTDGEDRELASISDDRVWFESAFADPDDGARTLAWLDADYSGEAVRIDTGRFDADPRAEHAMYEARNPLKCAALRRCGDVLSKTEQDFDPARLKISRQGLISYHGPDGTPVIRIGPVIDEEAYVRPIVRDDPLGIETNNMPVLDVNGWPERDAHGTVLTETRRISSPAGIEIDENGKLLNPVSYGALDRRSILGPDAANMPNNRFYGISAKIRPQSGYDHNAGSFIDRMEMATYQMGVLENIDRCMSMHIAAKNSDGRDGIARSLFYTNVGPTSLQKCYQSGTYLIDNPAKSAIAGCVLRDYLELANENSGIEYTNVLPVETFGDNDLFERAMQVSSLHMSQGQAYRDRVVFPKITVDQNIGLYNQAMNLHQCDARDSGRLDVKSMRDTDSRSARVALFQDNPYLDSVISGTAKSLGAVGYLTDAVRFDRLTGQADLDPKIKSAFDSGEHPQVRMPYISQGVVDFETGALTNIAPHTGGQAFDRQQLSTMGGLKCLNVEPGLKFAMVNLGFNMEDGYVVAKHAARKLGHFESDGSYKPLQKWDKIGDTESGNKGIVSKIVDTDIGAGMDDRHADDEFMARYLYTYLAQARVNHGGYDLNGRNGSFWRAVQSSVDRHLGYGQQIDLHEGFCRVMCGDGSTVGGKLNDLMRLSLAKGKKAGKSRERADQVREDIFQGLKPYLVDIGRDLEANGVQPFTGAYKAEHAVWQLFRDNPDLEVAVTNVCVCTRSNPSILMNIGEACDRDRARMSADGVDINDPTAKSQWLADNGESVLVMRDDDGYKIPVMGAAGRFAMYVDSHTADDKNIDYNKTAKSPKAGRRQAAQEGYALQGERCCEAYYEFMTANDPVLPDNLAKWNRKLAMNGFMFDTASETMESRRITDILNGAKLDEIQDSNQIAYSSDAMPGIRFVDMKMLAKQIVEQVPKGAAQDDIAKAVASMGEDLDFSKLLNLGRSSKAMAGSPKSIDDKLRYMFVTSLGRDGGGVVLLPDSLTNADMDVDIGLKETVKATDEITGRTYDKQVVSKVKLDGQPVMPDGTPRIAVPLFLSSREIANPDAELVTAPVDDRLQFRIFKTALASAVADELHDLDLIPEGDGHGRVPMLDDASHAQAITNLTERFEKLYRSAPDEASLSLDNMNAWSKKNIYYFSIQDSLTSVWNGDPTLSIDEIGISFEKAKSLGILKPKKDLDHDALCKIPDTYEFMGDRYEPLGEDDIIVVNRSPGQTTGCIRTFYPKVVCETGGGISTHPACATIFDGDYDGDTVGVGDPLHPKRLQCGTDEYEIKAAAARKELLSRMSMRGNMVHEADYDNIKLPDGSEIENVHPLFIAGNADYAVAKHNMREPDQDGMPVCGYDIDREISSVTIMANMLYELRNSTYDNMNGANGLITMTSAQNIIDARGRQIDAMSEYFRQMDVETGTGRDQKSAAFWKDIADRFDVVRDGFKSELPGCHEDTQKSVEALEKIVFDRFREAYDDMAAFISSKPLLTHGETQHEILHNIIHDANISRKGKEPQLNALLSYSSVGEACGGRLSVVKNADKKFELMVDGKTCEKFDPEIRMSNENPVSDVPRSTFMTQIESHTVAQSDKSDATGMGGAMAQKMQKLFSPAGYGAFGLRISGPITQSYLDAKQNVTKCGNNLKIGKFVLDSVAKFQKFDEFTDDAMTKADLNQVFRGQFTKSTSVHPKSGKRVPEYMTVDECIQQMDNFIQVMGHPGFTDIDKAIATAVLSKYESPAGPESERRIVKDPVRTADYTGDVTYAIMYGGDRVMPEILNTMEQNHRGPFSGSFGYDGRVDVSSIREALVYKLHDGSKLAESIDRILKPNVPESVGLPAMAPEAASAIVKEKSSVLARTLSKTQLNLSGDAASKILAGFRSAVPASCEGAFDRMTAKNASRQASMSDKPAEQPSPADGV